MNSARPEGQVLVLDVEVHHAGETVLAVGDVLEGRLDAAEIGALHAVTVLLEEGEAEDADGIRRFHERLDNGGVVLAEIDPGAIGTHGMGAGLEGIFIGFLQRGKFRDFEGAEFHAKLDESVARAGGRRGTEDEDRLGREVRGHFVPHLVGVRLEAALPIGHVLGECKVEFLLGQVEREAFFGIGDDDAVIAEGDFGDRGDTGGQAKAALGLLDRAGGVGDRGLGGADTGAEGLEAAAGAGRFYDRRGKGGRGAKALGNGAREGRDRGGSDDLDLLLGRGGSSHRCGPRGRIIFQFRQVALPASGRCEHYNCGKCRFEKSSEHLVSPLDSARIRGGFEPPPYARLVTVAAKKSDSFMTWGWRPKKLLAGPGITPYMHVRN